MKESFPEKIGAWAKCMPGVAAVVLIGSQAGSDHGTTRRADPFSDWDFVIFTSGLERYSNAVWLDFLGLGSPKIYAIRDGTVGSVRRISAIFDTAAMDFVLVPAGPWRLRRWGVAFGLHRLSRRITRSLADLAIVARPGFRLVYGSKAWDSFYRRVIAEVADPRLSDAMIRNRAQVFAADYVWIQSKLARGEHVSVQRVLFKSLFETNLQFLHELKLRRGEESFPEGRRFEKIASQIEREQLNLGPLELSQPRLVAATERAKETLVAVTQALLGADWRWPLSPADRDVLGR